MCRRLTNETIQERFTWASRKRKEAKRIGEREKCSFCGPLGGALANERKIE